MEKVYGIGFLDGDGHGLAVWKGSSLYSSFEKVQEVFLKDMKSNPNWTIKECGTEAYYGGGGPCRAGIIEFEVE